MQACRRVPKTSNQMRAEEVLKIKSPESQFDSERILKTQLVEGVVSTMGNSAICWQITSSDFYLKGFANSCCLKSLYLHF